MVLRKSPWGKTVSGSQVYLASSRVNLHALTVERERVFSKSASADEIRLLRTDAFSTVQGGGCKILEFMDRHVAG